MFTRRYLNLWLSKMGKVLERQSQRRNYDTGPQWQWITERFGHVFERYWVGISPRTLAIPTEIFVVMFSPVRQLPTQYLDYSTAAFLQILSNSLSYYLTLYRLATDSVIRTHSPPPPQNSFSAAPRKSFMASWGAAALTAGSIASDSKIALDSVNLVISGKSEWRRLKFALATWSSDCGRSFSCHLLNVQRCNRFADF
jgi:hypothetical protein